MLDSPATRPPSRPVTVELLGPVELRVGGEAVVIGPAKRRAVLAVLALDANRPVPVDRLIAVVWGDDPPARARNAVQGHVSALRRLLSEHHADADIGTGPTGYVLTVDAERVDAHRFGRLVERARTAEPRLAADLLAEALSLWQGPALAGIGNADRLTARLTEARYSAAEAHADLRLHLGAGRDVVADLLDLVAAEPLREGLVARLARPVGRRPPGGGHRPVPPDPAPPRRRTRHGPRRRTVRRVRPGPGR